MSFFFLHARPPKLHIATNTVYVFEHKDTNMHAYMCVFTHAFTIHHTLSQRYHSLKLCIV